MDNDNETNNNTNNTEKVDNTKETDASKKENVSTTVEEKLATEEKANSVLHAKEDSFYMESFPNFEERMKRINRSVDHMLGNSNGALSIKGDSGSITLSNKYAQINMNPGGNIETKALLQTNISNRFKIETDDIIINHHKLNNKFYELTDFKEVNKSTIDKDEINIKSGVAGHFCVLGTVLTKSWDIALGKYVLVRRIANIPMFSPEMSD